MRKYFILTYDDREDEQTVVDYEMGDFDVTKFWTGTRFSGRIPQGVRLWVDRGKPTDLLANPISWKIISDRFWAVLRPSLRRQDAQILSAIPLYYEGTQEPVIGNGPVGVNTLFVE